MAQLKEKTVAWLLSLRGKHMETLNFSHNWNSKLSSSEYTTIRIWKKNQWRRGDLVRIELKKNFLSYAGIVNVRKLKLHELTDEEIRNDTGMSRRDAYHLFEKFYGKSYLEKDYAFISFRDVSRNETQINTLLGLGFVENVFI